MEAIHGIDMVQAKFFLEEPIPRINGGIEEKGDVSHDIFPSVKGLRFGGL